MPTWIRGQIDGEPPTQFLSLDECRLLKSKGWGAFINRSKGFRRWDISTVPIEDDKKERSATGGLRSLKVDEAMIHAYVDGSGLARAAVHSYA